jgi:hypothetical protein
MKIGSRDTEYYNFTFYNFIIIKPSMSITNKWEDEKYVNKGSYAEVYRVKRHGRYYALKKIYPYILKNQIHR